MILARAADIKELGWAGMSKMALTHDHANCCPGGISAGAVDHSLMVLLHVVSPCALGSSSMVAGFQEARSRNDPFCLGLGAAVQ